MPAGNGELDLAWGKMGDGVVPGGGIRNAVEDNEVDGLKRYRGGGGDRACGMRNRLSDDATIELGKGSQHE